MHKNKRQVQVGMYAYFSGRINLFTGGLPLFSERIAAVEISQ